MLHPHGTIKRCVLGGGVGGQEHCSVPPKPLAKNPVAVPLRLQRGGLSAAALSDHIGSSLFRGSDSYVSVVGGHLGLVIDEVKGTAPGPSMPPCVLRC